MGGGERCIDGDSDADSDAQDAASLLFAPLRPPGSPRPSVEVRNTEPASSGPSQLDIEEGFRILMEQWPGERRKSIGHSGDAGRADQAVREPSPKRARRLLEQTFAKLEAAETAGGGGSSSSASRPEQTPSQRHRLGGKDSDANPSSSPCDGHIPRKLRLPPPRVAEAFGVLQLPASATERDVERKFRRMARQRHPDKVQHRQGKETSSQAKAAKDFRELHTAKATVLAWMRQGDEDSVEESDDSGPSGMSGFDDEFPAGGAPRTARKVETALFGEDGGDDNGDSAANDSEVSDEREAEYRACGVQALKEGAWSDGSGSGRSSASGDEDDRAAFWAATAKRVALGDTNTRGNESEGARRRRLLPGTSVVERRSTAGRVIAGSSAVVQAATLSAAAARVGRRVCGECLERHLPFDAGPEAVCKHCAAEAKKLWKFLNRAPSDS